MNPSISPMGNGCKLCAGCTGCMFCGHPQLLQRVQQALLDFSE